jgi:hypothetical protein
MAATVLAAIGGGSLLAIGSQRTIVMGVGTFNAARPVIVQMRDQGPAMVVAIMGVVMPRMGERRCRDYGCNH